MKKLKFNASSTNGEVLSREQLKKVIGGFNEYGSCQESGSSCSSPDMINCCNGLVCAKAEGASSGTCKTAT